MEERKWENLTMDCLVNVFERVGMESLLLDVPFVCKSWHKATLNPLSWKCLDFPFEDDSDSYKSFIERFQEIYGIRELSDTAFIKFIVDRSRGTATKLMLPIYCTQEALEYAANECPALEILGFPHLTSRRIPIYTELIGKWKNLKGLIIELPDILRSHDWYGLRDSSARILKEQISIIVASFPKIKYLDISWTVIEKESLITILQGCKELVHLDVSNCEDFEVDEEVSELASHIATFKYQGSRLRRDNPLAEFFDSLASDSGIVLDLEHLHYGDDDPEYNSLSEIIDEMIGEMIGDGEDI